MGAIKYDKASLERCQDIFNEYEEDDKETTLLYLGEDLKSVAAAFDKWLSWENGLVREFQVAEAKFDRTNKKHVRIFAKLDMINDELGELLNSLSELR